MSLYAQALSVASEAAREAGDLLRADLYLPTGPRGQGDHAEADSEAELLIRNRLLAAFPWNYLGEELGFTDRGDASHLWLVDPNDGTSAYLKGWRGSAVSIGLLRDRVPMLGVVFAFAYPDGQGDLITWAEGCPLRRNGLEIPLDRQADPLVLISQDADRNPATNASLVRPLRYLAVPSIAYRLARVAVGDGLAAVSLSRPRDWDYAAGHALLRAVGGTLLDQQGNPVTYDAQGHSSTLACFGGEADVALRLSQQPWGSALVSSSSPQPPFCLTRPRRGRLCSDDALLSRAQGCLLGQLAGDALGALVEFQRAEKIRALYPTGCRDMADGGTWNNLAGQPTDDSEMALTMARSLIHHGRLDWTQQLDAYLHWFNGPRWDCGGTIRQALFAASSVPASQRLRAVQESANPLRPTNGSLMRISPLGILSAGRPALGADWARADSRLTHPNELSQGACAVYVAALAAAIAEGLSPRACYEAALTEASRSAVPELVRRALAHAETHAPEDFVTEQGYVLIALQNTFYQLLHASSLEEGIIDTIMRGGDTDTTAAIAGALLGAVHGRQAFPRRWLQCLLSCRTLPDSGTKHPRTEEYWPVDALELAEALLCVGQSVSVD